MKWPLGAPGTVSRRGEICVKGEAEENNSAVLAERAPTLSIGTLGAATLDGPPYSWSFIKQDQGLRRLQLAGDTLKIVKESRDFPTLIDSYSVFEKAQMALDFMHMHYPEVDIPLDVMEVAIFESRDIPQSDKPMPGYHDYLKGNTLIVLGSSMPVACLPCGEVGHQLQIIPIIYQPNSELDPHNATPVIAFPTEIQQIVSQRYDTNVLAIRTLTAITLVSVIRAKGKHPMELSVIAEVDWSDLGQSGIPAVDIAFSPFDAAELLVITESGNAQILSFESDDLELEIIVPDAISFDESHAKNKCWKVGWISESEVMIAGDKMVKIFDRKSPDKPVLLYHVPQPHRHVITFVEASQIRPDSLLCITTTEHVVWLDRSQPLRPMISWRHDREFDRTLEARTVLVDSYAVTLLSSRCTSLLTVYDVQRIEGNDISSGPVYSLPTSKLSEISFFRRVGLASIAAPHSPSSSTQSPMTWLVEASPSHSLFVTPFAFDAIDVPLSASRSWSNTEFLRFMDGSRPELGPRANRQKLHMNMRQHLLHWFHRVVEDAENDVTETSLHALRRMRSVWESEENIECAMRCITAFDATAQHSEYPLDRRSRDPSTLSRQPHRLIYAAEASLATPPTMDCIASKSAWTYDMKEVLLRLDAAFSVLGLNDEREPGLDSGKPLWMLSPQLFADNAPQDDQIPEAPRTLVMAAAEILATDLSLSRHMLSNRRPVDPRLAPEDWFATDRDEIEPKTDHVHSPPGRQRTGFLPAHWAPPDEDELQQPSAGLKNKPLGRNHKLVYKEAREDDKQNPKPKSAYKRQKGGGARNPDLMPRTDGSKKPKTWARSAKVGTATQALGVRILLQEWNIGEDPDDYVFKPIFAPLSNINDKIPNQAKSQHAQSQSQPPSWPHSQNMPSALHPIDSRNKAKAPPVLVPSSQLAGPASRARPNLNLSSQRQAQSLGDWAFDTQAGDEVPAMSNTQVLPGPFGGRAPPKKKRAGF